MSLAQHVSATEGTDRQPLLADYPGEDFEPLRKVLSYDVFPPPPEQLDEHAAAYKVSTFQRAVQVAITVLACWFASGIVYGYAALRPVLISEGVYREHCTDEELSEGVYVCLKQDIRLNLFFTLASITANVSALPVGTILDRYGPRVCGILGSITLAIGSLLMAFAFRLPDFDGYLLGNFFLALGGTFVFVPSFQMANAFPKYSGTIVALITGSFDASAAVFLFYRLAYDSSNHTFGPEKFFFAYLIVPSLIFIAQLTILPAHSYDTRPQLELKMEKAKDSTRDVHFSDDEIDSNAELREIRSARKNRRQSKIKKLDKLMGDAEERQEWADREEERHETSGVWGVLHGLPAHKQMLTPWFVLITLLTVLQMLRMNYFIATIRSQYEYMLNSQSWAEEINHFFDIALPVGGAAATPFIGLFLDNTSVTIALVVIVTLTTIIGILNSIPFIWAGYTTVLLFVLLRPLYYSAMSDYATKIFGFQTFGRVYGSIICLSGIFQFSQAGLDALTLGPLGGNPTPVNIALAAAGFGVGIMLVGFVWRQGKILEQEKMDEETAMERQGLVPVQEEGEQYGTF